MANSFKDIKLEEFIKLKPSSLYSSKALIEVLFMLLSFNSILAPQKEQ